MYQGKLIGVVIPAYNEEGFVGDVIDSIPTFVDRIYVVDDRSTDGTWEEIKGRVDGRSTVQPSTDGGADLRFADDQLVASEGPRERDPDDGADVGRVVPIRHKRNQGVGGAIKTGYRMAVADDIDVVAVMGGDGQMDPDELERIIDPVVRERVSYAKGNRLTSRESRGRMSRWRLLGNVVLSLLTKIASGYWQINDPQDGYTAISGEALEIIDLDSMYEYYGYCNDLLVKLNVHELSVADVPRTAIYEDEESHIRYAEYIPRVSAMLARNFLWRLKRRYLFRDFHPLLVLYSIGCAMVLWACATAFAGRIRRNERDELQRSGCSGRVETFGLGVIALAEAMVLDRAENEELCVSYVDRTPEGETTDRSR